MIEAHCGISSRRTCNDTAAIQVGYLFFHIIDEPEGERHGEILTYDKTLHVNVLQVFGQRIRGNEPSAHAQAIGKIVERPLHIGILFKGPAHYGYLSCILVDSEQPHLLDSRAI